MSLTDKFRTLMSRPNEDLVAKDDVPWWLKYAGRIVGTVGGAFAIFLGAWNCAGIVLAQIWCFLSGIWQMLAGFLLIIVEAPCCCMCIDYAQTLSDWIDKRPYWNRGLAYVLIALPPILLCINLSSILGCGCIFATGVLYGFMALGRKGSREDMAAMATPHQGLTSPTVGQPDHSATLMEDPDVWRPT